MTTTANQNIKETATYKMVDNEARELSVTTQNIMYVILRNNSLITSMSKEDGIVLSAWDFGNPISF